MTKNYLDEHPQARKRLKTAGFICTPIGAICIIIALIDFFICINKMTQPRLFFLFFIGIPALGIGLICLMLGFMREMANYSVNETAEARRKNIRIIKDEVKDFMDDSIYCPKCNCANKKGSKFCQQCGSLLESLCPKCGGKIESGAIYCPHCGEKL